MKCYYFIIPLFHYSCWEYAEWLAGNPLLSGIHRNSAISNYNVQNYKPNGMHPSMQSCNIISTHLFFPSSYLLSFPSSIFTPWPPEAKGITIKIVRDYTLRGLKSQSLHHN
jgi:hypothetical protein